MTNALFVAARRDTPYGGQWAPVGRLEYGPGGYRFRYLRGALQPGLIHPLPEMPHLDRVYESEELFPLFSNR